MSSTTAVCLIFALVYVNLILAVPLPKSDEQPNQGGELWFSRLLMNLMGYSTILVPAYFIIKYFKRIKYNETGM